MRIISVVLLMVSIDYHRSAQPSMRPLTSANAAGAQSLGANWFAAFRRAEVGTLVQMADFPFYTDDEVLAGPNDMHQYFQKLWSGPLETKLIRIEAKTIAEWKKGNFDLERYTVLGRVTHNDDDFLVLLDFEIMKDGWGFGHGQFLYMRKVGGEIKLAGSWNDPRP